MTKTLSSLPTKPLSALRQMDEILALEVMGWERWQEDWYLSAKGTEPRKFQVYYPLWCPTRDSECSMRIWLRCLHRAKETNYKLSMNLEGNNVHIVGDHPTFRRLGVIDPDIHIGICRFAFELFGLTLPSPYDHNPG
jgi:hypothetical protein